MSIHLLSLMGVFRVLSNEMDAKINALFQVIFKN